MADKSVGKPKLDIPEEQYSFERKYISCINNTDFMTMDYWVSSSGLSKNSELMLQMDIEGSEYYSIISMSDDLIKRFRIMVIEFHHLGNFWNKRFFSLAKMTFEKILHTHICVHNHPNNYCGVETVGDIDIPQSTEFTFIRKDRVKTKTYERKFPHNLDRNNSSKSSLVLPRCWYKN